MCWHRVLLLVLPGSVVPDEDSLDESFPFIMALSFRNFLISFTPTICRLHAQCMISKSNVKVHGYRRASFAHSQGKKASRFPTSTEQDAENTKE